MNWYLKWLDACGEANADHRSLPERVRAAVQSAGARRGLALTTKRCYGAWAARYAAFGGDERSLLRVETATEIYLHVAIGVSGLGVTSPLDRMGLGGSAE